MTDVLTQGVYEQRRAELAERQEAAKAEFRRVALKRERGSAEAAEVDEARSAVTQLEEQQAALEDAWQEAQAEAALQAAEADAELRRHVHGDVRHLEQNKRQKAFTDLVEHLRGVGKFVQAYDDACEEVRALLAPFSRDIKGREHESGFTDLLRTLRSRHHEAEIILGVLNAEGVWGVGSLDARRRNEDWLNKMKGQAVLSAADRILPDEDLEEAA